MNIMDGKSSFEDINKMFSRQLRKVKVFKRPGGETGLLSMTRVESVDRTNRQSNEMLNFSNANLNTTGAMNSMKRKIKIKSSRRSSRSGMRSTQFPSYLNSATKPPPALDLRKNSHINIKDQEETQVEVMGPNAFQRVDFSRVNETSKSAVIPFFSQQKKVSAFKDDLIVEDYVDDEVQIGEPSTK